MNCIWITVDSFRRDHVGCYSPAGTSDPTAPGFHVHTPNIDRLAAQGVMCERLRNEALPTVPARRGMFTGRRVFPFAEEPTHKGMCITLPGWRPIPQSDVTVAEHLSANGYTCALICDCYHLMKPSQNFHRGFQCFQWERGQEYDMYQSQPLPEGYLERFLKPGTELTEARARVLTQYLRNQMYRESDEDYQAAKTFGSAIRWLERNSGSSPFYLHIESFDPHEPWEAPRRFIDMYDPDWDGPELIYANLYRREMLTDEEHHHVRARYAAECTMVDYWIGRLLDTVEALGLAEDTLVILLSDHGKIVGEWGYYGMPQSCTGLELNAVPCVLRHPGGENAGTRFASWLYNTDVTVTMLSLLGLPDKPGMDGEDFWPAIGAGAEFRDHAVVGHGEFVSAWEDDWLYLVDTQRGDVALYHLGEDPFRQEDVSERYPADRHRLRERVESLTGSA